MTEEWVPYQYEKDGELVGISVDLLVLLLERTALLNTPLERIHIIMKQSEILNP